jgi:alpha-glucosidase
MIEEHVENKLVLPDELDNEDFFMSTFGKLITANLEKQAHYDELYAHTVKKNPYILELALNSKIVYGTGERTFDLNLYGRKLSLWNTDAGSWERGWEPINYTVPFLLIVEENNIRGVFVDNTYRGTVDIGYTKPNILRFEFEGQPNAVHIFHGSTIDDVLEQFTALTGRMPMPPLWVLGKHQCRYSYMNQEEVLTVAREFRQRNIPCDAIYLDIHYMDNYKCFTWNTETFPDFKGMIDELHGMGMKVVVIIDPGIKVETGYSVYETGLADDVFMKYPDGKPAEGIVWPGLTVHPDFTNPKARDWWAKQLKPILDAGVDGVWNDMNEPLYFGKGEAVSPRDYLVHDNEGKGGTHAQLHNVYGMNMSRATLQGLQTYRPNKRQLNITRAGYAGTQKYASSWTGDNKSTWDDLRVSIPMNLNLAMSGQNLTGPDIGGFALDTEPELLLRWYQACVLFPFYRNHSAVDSIRQEPWLFGKGIEQHIRAAIELRYQLLPYLYTATAECHKTGKPIMRPVFTAEPTNASLYNVDDCYMIGTQLLVAPVLQKHTLRRNVYLPVGTWYAYDDPKTPISGGQTITVEAGLGVIPIFVKAGTVLPHWKIRQHQDEVITEVTFKVYPGDGVTTLYEDEGEGLGYQNGQYRMTTFTQTYQNGQVNIIRTTHGNYPNMPKHIAPTGISTQGF